MCDSAGILRQYCRGCTYVHVARPNAVLCVELRAVWLMELREIHIICLVDVQQKERTINQADRRALPYIYKLAWKLCR